MFFAVKILVHEVAYAFVAMRFYPKYAKGAIERSFMEPHFERVRKKCIPEAGEAWERSVFRGKLVEFGQAWAQQSRRHIDDLGSMGIYVHVKDYTISVRMEWIVFWFRKDDWQLFQQHGRAALPQFSDWRDHGKFYLDDSDIRIWVPLYSVEDTACEADWILGEV